MHKVNTKYLKFSDTKEDNFLWYFKPADRVKFSISIGANLNILQKVNVDTLNSASYRHAFSDIESTDIPTMVKMDARMKIYLSAKYRLLFKVTYLNKPFISAGTIIKIGNKKHNKNTIT